MRVRITNNLTVMLIPLTVLLCLGSSASAKICESNTYWSSYSNECKPCTVCEQPNVVIRPCQSKDTVCGPLSDLNIDWSWMKRSSKNKHDAEKEMTETFNDNMQKIRLHEMLVKEKERILKKLQNKDSDELITPEQMIRTERMWRRLQGEGKETKIELSDDLVRPKRGKIISEDPKVIQFPYDEKNHFSKEEAEQLLNSVPKLNSLKSETNNANRLVFDDDGNLVKHFSFFPVDNDDDLEEEDHEPEVEEFSTTEKFILDWQTGVLALAVASCFIFFLIISCYSLSHVRNWKTIQAYIGKDAEELQQWLTPKKSSHPPSGIYKATTEVIHKEGGHCKYLERIITKNAKKLNRVPSNVYHGAHPSIETRPLTAEDVNVHKSINI